ncbi:DUF3576 domain-containing protein [Radicibacter daui]|uniref:DUF3576 domain-containing protein n=1 Tax=Radicibacter daui TaxID=3064829 RepID=UPI004046E900
MPSLNKKSLWRLGVLATLTLALGACDTLGIKPAKPGENEKKRESILGEGGIVLGGASRAEDSDPAGVGVNPYLWRAALDTIGFMPLASADPFGGVILTDWYSPPTTPDERLKLNVFLIGRALRADGVHVSVFRQVRSPNGWADAQPTEGAGAKLEDAVLTRARQLRIEAGDK